MLDGHDDLLVTPAQVEIAVSPGVQLTAPAQGLARPAAAALSCVMDEQDGGFEPALQLAQKAEDGGDLRDGVLVDAVQADQGVEDQEARFDALHRFLQALTIGRPVETQGGHIDDGDVEFVEGGGGGVGDPLQAFAHLVSRVFGREQQHGAAPRGAEVAQAWHACGDGDGEVEREEGLAALGLAADDADALLAPERLDHPLLRLGPVLEVGRAARREALHRRVPLRGAGSPRVSMKSLSSRTSRSCSQAVASRASAMTVSALGLPAA